MNNVKRTLLFDHAGQFIRGDDVPGTYRSPHGDRQDLRIQFGKLAQEQGFRTKRRIGQNDSVSASRETLA